MRLQAFCVTKKICLIDTSYYCVGYAKGYNVTWNNLAANRQTSNPSPNPSASNSTSLPITSNTNTTVANPHAIISPSSDNWVGPFVISVSVVIIIGAIA